MAIKPNKRKGLTPTQKILQLQDGNIALNKEVEYFKLAVDQISAHKL